MITFKNSKGFRGFKRANIVCHGICDLPKTEPNGDEIKLEPIKDGFKVFMDGQHIGSLFAETAEAIAQGNVTDIHIHFDQTDEGFRPRIFLKFKE